MTVPIEPGWLSLLPPLAAIVLALALPRGRDLALRGDLAGRALPQPDTTRSPRRSRASTGSPSRRSRMRTTSSIIVFSLMLGGMVGVMNRNGGTRGIVEACAGSATTRRRGQFLDVAGRDPDLLRRLRQHADRGQHDAPGHGPAGRVAREARLHRRLDGGADGGDRAHLDVGRLRDHADRGCVAERRVAATDPALQADLLAAAENPFSVFLHSIPYLFYPILTLIFVLLTC